MLLHRIQLLKAKYYSIIYKWDGFSFYFLSYKDMELFDTLHRLYSKKGHLRSHRDKLICCLVDVQIQLINAITACIYLYILFNNYLFCNATALHKIFYHVLLKYQSMTWYYSVSNIGWRRKVMWHSLSLYCSKVLELQFIVKLDDNFWHDSKILH